MSAELGSSLLSLSKREEFSQEAWSLCQITLDALVHIDRLNRAVVENLAAEKNLMELLTLRARSKDLNTGREYRHTVVETSHNYAPNSQEERRVNFPGASHVCLTFDPRCSTEAGQDTLQLLNNKGEPFRPPLNGKPESWPKNPVIVQGDSVTFIFQATGFTTYWGYRCIASPFYLQPANILNHGAVETTWLYELERIFAGISKSLLVKSVSFKTDDAEKEVQAWLDSPLFRGGLWQQNTEEQIKFIDDFVKGTAGSPAQSLWMKVEKSLPAANATIDRMGGEVRYLYLFIFRNPFFVLFCYNTLFLIIDVYDGFDSTRVNSLSYLGLLTQKKQNNIPRKIHI